MSFGYGADWDWEQSLRAEEIKEAIKAGNRVGLADGVAEVLNSGGANSGGFNFEGLAGGVAAVLNSGGEANRAKAKIKKIIDGFRPVSSGPEWRVAFELLSGQDVKKSSEVSTGVSKANSSTFSLETSYKVGLKMDALCCENSGKATATTTVETIMSSSHVERVDRTYKFTSDNSNKQNEVHLYYQLVFIVKYADKKETKLNTNILRRMIIQGDVHKGEYPLPPQSAEDEWACLSR